MDVGKNIGAELQMSQAEADRRIAQAKASERQYAAQAAEQEMKAETQRMRAKVVEAEANVPQAIAEAFRTGNLGVMDYYRMKNIQADSDMRGSISTSVNATSQWIWPLSWLNRRFRMAIGNSSAEPSATRTQTRTGTDTPSSATLISR